MSLGSNLPSNLIEIDKETRLLEDLSRGIRVCKCLKNHSYFEGILDLNPERSEIIIDESLLLQRTGSMPSCKKPNFKPNEEDIIHQTLFVFLDVLNLFKSVSETEMLSHIVKRSNGKIIIHYESLNLSEPSRSSGSIDSKQLRETAEKLDKYKKKLSKPLSHESILVISSLITEYLWGTLSSPSSAKSAEHKFIAEYFAPILEELKRKTTDPKNVFASYLANQLSSRITVGHLLKQLGKNTDNFDDSGNTLADVYIDYLVLRNKPEKTKIFILELKAEFFVKILFEILSSANQVH